MNQTKKCRACQTDIPLQAKKCPNCQTDLRNFFFRHPIISIIILVPLIIIILTSLSDSKESVEEAEIRASETILGTLMVDADIGDGLEAGGVSLFKSHEDRTLVIQLESGMEVLLLNRRIISDKGFEDPIYKDFGKELCEIRYGEHKGWLDCEWLK